MRYGGVMKEEKRFVEIHEESTGWMNNVILVDRETGVTYLLTGYRQMGGLTPLLDPDGKPVITKLDEEV